MAVARGDPLAPPIDAQCVYSFLEKTTHPIKKAPVRCAENQKNPRSRASRIAPARLSFHSEQCARARTSEERKRDDAMPQHPQLLNGDRGRGRPSLNSKQLTDDILARIAAGQSLNSICKLDGMPHISTVFDWLRKDHVFADNYAQARATQADAKFEEISDVARKVIDGEIDPHAARVFIDAVKWQAAKLRPSVYGDKVEHIIRSTNAADLTDDELARIAAASAPALLAAPASPPLPDDDGESE